MGKHRGVSINPQVDVDEVQQPAASSEAPCAVGAEMLGIRFQLLAIYIFFGEKGFAGRFGLYFLSS